VASVKGSKQHQMMVVPYRPFYRFGVFFLCLLLLGGFCWSTYEFGLKKGLATKVQVITERDSLKLRLQQRDVEVLILSQQVADLKVGEQIDTQATEEVRSTDEELQGEIAELSEEIRFYKGVMLPNVEEQGLRIERWDMKQTNEPNTINFSLLLTQVVEKHQYLQGGVEIIIVGNTQEGERSLALQELRDDKQNSIRFRFRYFQNIDGELRVPKGFEPRQVMVIAKSTGGNNQRLEKKFDWQLDGD
jgi:hypothetical protein